MHTSSVNSKLLSTRMCVTGPSTWDLGRRLTKRSFVICCAISYPSTKWRRPSAPGTDFCCSCCKTFLAEHVRHLPYNSCNISTYSLQYHKKFTRTRFGNFLLTVILLNLLRTDISLRYFLIYIYVRAIITIDLISLDISNILLLF